MSLIKLAVFDSLKEQQKDPNKFQRADTLGGKLKQNVRLSLTKGKNLTTGEAMEKLRRNWM